MIDSSLSSISPFPPLSLFFFFNDTATTEIYTLSLHDALPISRRPSARCKAAWPAREPAPRPRDRRRTARPGDRKSTRLNSSHQIISYAVFCLKKKKKNTTSGELTHRCAQEVR